MQTRLNTETGLKLMLVVCSVHGGETLLWKS